MRRRLLLPLAIALTVLFPFAAGAASGVSVTQITFDNDRDAETSIAINPTNSNNVIGGWISSGDLTCGVGTSSNGGRTWRVGVIPGIQKNSGGSFDRGTDPSIAFDSSGNAYYTCLAFDLFPPGVGSAGTVFVSKSTDGGTTWGAPVIAFTGVQVNDFQDHQFITTNPVTGDVYLTQTNFTSFGKSQIQFTRSTDGGKTFSPPVAISDLGGNATFQESYTATGKNPSTIYLVYGAFSNAGLSDYNRMYITRSADGGRTFAARQLLQTITPLPSPLPNGSWRTANNLWVAVDRTTNQIYVNYTDYNDGDANVRVLHVADVNGRFVPQGVTTVSPGTAGSDQFLPFITVAPGGRVDVCYQDRSYVPGNALLFTTCAFSTDGALSFTHAQVTTTGFDASNNNFIGDYNMQASTSSLVMPIFVGDGVPGGASGDQEVFTARVSP